MQPKGVAIRKRTQIAKANRVMFLWVAAVSAVVGLAAVISIFLGQMLFFNERVLQEKDKTVATLAANNDSVTALESQIRALDANQALIDSKARPSDQALQVILDALPADANSLALGASLQNELLTGVTINSLQVDPVVGVETLGSGQSKNVTSNGQPQINFRFSVSGSAEALKNVLRNLESSIRTIDILSLKIENQGDARALTVQARAFYEPSRDVKLRDKTVK